MLAALCSITLASGSVQLSTAAPVTEAKACMYLQVDKCHCCSQGEVTWEGTGTGVSAAAHCRRRQVSDSLLHSRLLAHLLALLGARVAQLRACRWLQEIKSAVVQGTRCSALTCYSC
jgi:hypothetical protein